MPPPAYPPGSPVPPQDAQAEDHYNEAIASADDDLAGVDGELEGSGGGPASSSHDHVLEALSANGLVQPSTRREYFTDNYRTATAITPIVIAVDGVGFVFPQVDKHLFDDQHAKAAGGQWQLAGWGLIGDVDQVAALVVTPHLEVKTLVDGGRTTRGATNGTPLVVPTMMTEFPGGTHKNTLGEGQFISLHGLSDQPFFIVGTAQIRCKDEGNAMYRSQLAPRFGGHSPLLEHTALIIISEDLQCFLAFPHMARSPSDESRKNRFKSSIREHMKTFDSPLRSLFEPSEVSGLPRADLNNLPSLWQPATALEQQQLQQPPPPAGSSSGSKISIEDIIEDIEATLDGDGDWQTDFETLKTRTITLAGIRKNGESGPKEQAKVMTRQIESVKDKALKTMDKHLQHGLRLNITQPATVQKHLDALETEYNRATALATACFRWTNDIQSKKNKGKSAVRRPIQLLEDSFIAAKDQLQERMCTLTRASDESARSRTPPPLDLPQQLQPSDQAALHPVQLAIPFHMGTMPESMGNNNLDSRSAAAAVDQRVNSDGQTMGEQLASANSTIDYIEKLAESQVQAAEKLAVHQVQAAEARAALEALRASVAREDELRKQLYGQEQLALAQASQSAAGMLNFTKYNSVAQSAVAYPTGQQALMPPGQQALMLPGQQALMPPGQQALMPPGQQALMLPPAYSPGNQVPPQAAQAPANQVTEQQRSKMKNLIGQLIGCENPADKLSIRCQIDGFLDCLGMTPVDWTADTPLTEWL